MAKHGRYKIVRKVADGGMAEIFLATQLGREGFQKPVILKRIHSTIYADPQFRNMFLDEAHISMALSHSNIVQVLDLGLGGGRYFLVMELVDGWDLGRLIQRAAAARFPMMPELGMYITAEVLRGLAYAHGMTQAGNPLGIVHRDISPHNVLVSEQGEVKLTDFGIAKAMNKREQTGTGVVKGKVSFMSPEQALGKPIDARSDLFSMGTVLYQLMTGVRPFEAPTDLEILLRVQKAEFRTPEEARPDMEPELAHIMMRAMKLDPADRYQSADEMLADVERVMRTVFPPAGPTELKRWLGDLQREDGAPSIGKAPALSHSTRTGTAELEGKDVELSDSESDNDPLDVGEENTSLAVLSPGGADGRPRLSRHRPAGTELPLPVPEDDEAALSGRHSQSELALPIPEVDDGPPKQRFGRGSGRWLGLLLVGGVLLIVGAALAGSYLGSRAEGDVTPAVGAAAVAPAPVAPPPPSPATRHAGEATPAATKEPAPAPPPAAPAVAAPAPAAAAAPTAKPAPTAAAPAATPPSPANKKPRDVTAESGRAIIELKNMMQPDPSQLPPPPPPAATPTPPPPAAAAPPPPPPPAPAKPAETPPPAPPAAPSTP
jgi:serine/threonine-protein kinase